MLREYVTGLAGLSFISLSLIYSPAVDAKVYQPSKSACPLESGIPLHNVNVSKTPNGTTYKFGSEVVVRRVEIIAARSGKDISKASTEVSFTWTPNDPSWGKKSGAFAVSAYEKSHCYFLGHQADLPENVSVKELAFSVPDGAVIKKITLAETPSDRKMITCPKRDVFSEVESRYEFAIKQPDSEVGIERFVSAFAKLFDRYDCRRNFDYEPVPAWWLCEEPKNEYSGCSESQIEKWLAFLAATKHPTARKLFGSEKFRSTLDGAYAEGYLEKSRTAEGEVSK